MKKLIVLTLVSLAISIQAQDKYLSILGGYGIGVPGNKGVEIIEYSDGERTETVKYINFGSGLLVDVAYGSPIGKSAHFELGVGYQNNLGSTLESTFYTEHRNSANQLVEMKETSIRTINASSFRFAPGLRFMAGEGKTRGFAKVAPQLIIAQVTSTFEFNSENLHVLSEDEYSREASFGFVASLGFEHNVSNRVVMFSCISGSSGYYSPDEWKFVKYEYDGEDVLDKIPLRDKQTYFSKEIDENANSSNASQATRSLKTRMDYSSISLNIGIRFLL